AVMARPHLVVDVEVLLHVVPRFLRNHQQADAELGHDRYRVGADRGGERSAAEGLERLRPDVASRLLYEAAIELHPAALEPFEHEPRRLDEALARFVHRYAEAVEFDAPESTADAEDHPPARQV